MARVVLMVSIKDFGMAALFPLGIIRFETVSMNILSLFLDAALTAVLFAIVHFYTLAGFLSDNKSLSGMVIEDRIVYYCPAQSIGASAASTAFSSLRLLPAKKTRKRVRRGRAKTSRNRTACPLSGKPSNAALTSCSR